MKLVIVGAGGLARVVAEMITQGSLDEVAGFVDDSVSPAKQLQSLPVLGSSKDLPKLAADGVASGAVIAIGNSQVRLKLAQVVRDAGLVLPAIVAVSATVSPSAKLSEGVIVVSQAVIGPDVTVGPLSIINTAAVIEHDACIDEACYVGPRALIDARAKLGREVSVQGGQVVGPDEQLS